VRKPFVPYTFDLLRRKKTEKPPKKFEVDTGQLLTLMFDLQWGRENFNCRDWQLVVRDILCPPLRQGDVVVWDNLPAHRSVVARKLVEAAGATLLPLPSYSPDLNPIELSFRN